MGRREGKEKQREIGLAPLTGPGSRRGLFYFVDSFSRVCDKSRIDSILATPGVREAVRKVGPKTG